MKRLNFDGQSLVTGTEVADALTDYAETVARMNTSAIVDIPILEENGTIATHTLLLNSATALETFDIDGNLEEEADRFPVPPLPSIGGKAIPVSTGEISGISLPMDD